MKNFTLIHASVLCVLCANCGSEGESDVFSDTDVGGTDGGTSDSDNTGGNINPPPESCDLIPTPFPLPSDLVGFISTNDGTDVITLEGAQEDNLFSVQFKLGNGLFDPNISATTYVIDENEADLNTCNLCATIVGSFNSENSQFLHLLAAQEGVLSLTASGTENGGSFAGTFSNMVFREVIELNGTYVEVENGCTSNIDNLGFNVTLQSPPN